MGFRTPSVKKSFSAKTTGSAKRKVKKAINPTYGRKGTGVIRNPKKAAYNKVYNKTTVGLSDIVSSKSKSTKNVEYNEPAKYTQSQNETTSSPKPQVPFHKRSWVFWLIAIWIPPIAIGLLFSDENQTKNKKIIGGVILIVYTIAWLGGVFSQTASAAMISFL